MSGGFSETLGVKGGETRAKRERLKPPLSASADQITPLALLFCFKLKSTTSVLSLHYSGGSGESEEYRPHLTD